MKSWWKITIFGVFFTVAVLVWILTVGISAGQPGSFYNKGHNAVWIGHEWVGEQKTEVEIQELVLNFKKHQIDTVFVHSGPLNNDGGIEPETYKFALHFIDTARKFDQNIDYQAWLGQIRSKIDLSDEEVRHNVAKQAMIMSQLVGFDGVHFDIEPVWDLDKDFILTLKEAREIMPKDKNISVALAEFIPGSLIWFLENLHQFENFNTEVNYENVAKYADQLVVMNYDTGINKPWLYRLLVKEQTIWLTDLLEGKELFVAIPAYEYEETNDWFNPEAENVENGLKGIIDGLNNIRSDEENFAGVAIYPYWEIDDQEWEIYDRLWLK